MFFNPCRAVPRICQASVTGTSHWEQGGRGCWVPVPEWRGGMGWGVGGLVPGLEGGFPFLPILHGPCTESPKKGGQGCSHGSREEHPHAVGGSPGMELPLRRIPEQEWNEWEQRWTQLFSWGSITRGSWESGSAQLRVCQYTCACPCGAASDTAAAPGHPERFALP